MKPAAIFLARSGNNYRVKAPGWQRTVPADGIKDALAQAWMQYGDNPSGCQIVGNTEGLEDYIGSLTSGRKSTSIFIRVNAAEKAAIEQAAKAAGHSISSYFLALHRQASSK